MPKLPDDELVQRVAKDFRDAIDHTADWRDTARTAYDYFAGKQWTSEDIAKFKEEERPVITFNRISVFVKAVQGLEVSNRQEMIYEPGEVNDTGAVNIANGTAKWVKKKCDSADEQSAAFFDLIISGMGFAETFISFDQDLDGKICEEQVDPLECYWDARAKKRNLIDARWIGRLKEFTREEFDERWPGRIPSGEILGVADFIANNQTKPHNADPPAYQDDALTGSRRLTGSIWVLMYQYFDEVDVVRFAEEGVVREMSPADFDKANERLASIGEQTKRGLKQKKRMFYRAFLNGEEVLEHDDLSLNMDNKLPDFTLQAMTGEYDRNDGIWNGLVKNMIDPQNWANKYFSQAHDYLNSGIKSTVWYDEDAVSDIAEFEENVAKPGGAVKFAAGALANKKVLRPEPPKIPSAMFQLHDFAVNALPSVTGLNPELLGLAGRDQPGILESQRKQAGLTILATMFDAIRYYRVRQGRVLLWFMKNFIDDQRLVRINGEQNAKFVPQFKKAVTENFDINVGEAPTSPHMKERVFTMFTQIMQLVPGIATSVLPMLIKYSPFPMEVVQPLLEQLEKSQEESPEQQIAKKLAFDQATADLQETKSKALLNAAKALETEGKMDFQEVKAFQDTLAKVMGSFNQGQVGELQAERSQGNGSSS